MEHSIHNETATPATHDDNWQPRPELLQAMYEIADIAAYDDSAMVSDREVSFANGPLRTSIIASEVDLVTIDGFRISERIDIRTPLPDVIAEMTAEQIAVANTMATTGAIDWMPPRKISAEKAAVFSDRAMTAARKESTWIGAMMGKA